MRRCPGCYKEGNETYCSSCRKKLFDGIKISHKLNFERPKDENLDAYQSKTRKLSISGVQLKYSLRIENKELVLTDTLGQYIIKPVPPTVEIKMNSQAPENEHLTMQIARQVFRIETAENALIFFSDGAPAYITRRFDVKADGSKFLQEDMAQLSGKTKQTHGEDFKYEGDYSEVGTLIRKYAAAALPALERFFEVVLFNYVFSNGDAHLKNFSLIATYAGDFQLSKAYDLMSTALHTPLEFPTALDLYDGDKNDDYFYTTGVYGQTAFRELAKRLGLAEVRTNRILTRLCSSSDKVELMIANSLLSQEAKEIYLQNYKKRLTYLQA